MDKVSSSNGTSEEYFYDSHGRLVKKAEVIDGKTFITETSYNAANNLPETTTYPSGLKVKNEYDATGYLNAVKNQATGYTYWTASKRNARGQLESIVYGNKLITSVTYNAQKGYITDISTGGIQNWSYAFNTVGNLTDRRNNLRNLSEHFEYDELDRLVKVSHNNVLKQEMRYDAMGNLTYKTGVGSLFIYQNGTNRLVSVTGGGYNPKAWDEITYTAYSKVSYIRSGADSQSILYGPSQQRKKTVTVVDGVTETKYYCGGLYEEVQKGGETKKISYIFADGESIAIFEQSTVNGDKLLYLHKDHLGSVQALTNESGALVQELSYDAWGKRRNPINWEDYSSISAANSLTPWGFTGHEHMDMFDIVNMDGRMYDPVLGRFLSPDPFVQAPDYTQGLNRYIYCLNNPLSLFDPTGYSWFSKAWKSIVAAVVGIAVSVVTLGAGTTVGAFLIAGALGGAAAGLTGALLNGANLGQIAKSTFSGGFWGAVGSFLSFASGGGQVLERLFKHTFSQAWLEGVRGGNIKHGMIAGALSVVGGEAIDKYGSGLGKTGKITVNAVIAGTAEELGGGKFANGAITGAYCMIFNDLMHKVVDKVKARVSIKRLKQNATCNCIPACAEVVSYAFGEEISQDEFRKLAGGNPETDMINDGDFWTKKYAGKTGHKVVWKNSGFMESITAIRDTLSEGGLVTMTLSANHSVVVESIAFKYVDDNFKSLTIRVMDPAIGDTRNMNFTNRRGETFVNKFRKQVYNLFYFRK